MDKLIWASMKPYSLDLRQKIVDTSKADGSSQCQLAERFRAAPSFIQKLLKQYRETGSLALKAQAQQTTKLNSAQLATLKPLVAEHNDATLRDLVQTATGVSIGPSTVDRLLKKLNLTLKKTLHPSEKESELVQLKRTEYWELMQGMLAKNLIFIDEADVNLALTQLFARSPTGQRARGKHPSKRGKNVSMISAIGLAGVITQLPLLGAVDARTFEALIGRKLVPKLWKGRVVSF